MGLKLKKIGLRIRGPEGTTEMPLTRATVPEGIMIEKSIEFFDDPEPCMIHRSAVQSRLFLEILNAFEESGLDSFPLPDTLKRYVFEGKHPIEIFCYR